jgi:hypothetical protein
MYTMDCLVFFLVIRHGKEEKKNPVRVLYPMPREEKKEVQIAKRTKRVPENGRFLRLLKWKYLSLGEVINPLMVGHPLQYTSI